MTASYQHLALADVRPGMILSDVLLDPQGKVLLPEGATLTDAIIALLPRHGVDRLPILCARPSEVQHARDLNVCQRRLSMLFRKHDPANDTDWATGTLRQYVENFRLGGEEQP